MYFQNQWILQCVLTVVLTSLIPISAMRVNADNPKDDGEEEDSMAADESPADTQKAESEGNAVLPLADPAPRTNLFLNPFNKLSAHHRPVGAGAQYGVPGTSGPPTRGRINVVTLFRCGDTKQGRKYIYQVSENAPTRTVNKSPDSPSECGLPATIKVPSGVQFPSNSGDSNVILCPQKGGLSDFCQMFMNWNNNTSKAKYMRKWSLAGLDTGGGADSFDRGSSASRLRWPGTVLRGFEINPASPAPIRHCLNVTATRHSKKGASKNLHVLSKKYVWPAYGTDGSANSAGSNLGDIPYGTRLVIRWQDRNLRETLGLSARGKVLFDTLLYYGVYVVDGQGQVDPKKKGAIMQLRIDQEVKPVGDIDDSLMKILPHLWPLRNPRPLNSETELWSDGLPYAGGGGPLDPKMSVNTAWDVPAASSNRMAESNPSSPFNH